MPNTNGPCLEDEMQKQVADYFSLRKFESSNPKDRYYGNRIILKVYREVGITQIGRISDIIIYITDRKIVNIECKMIGYEEVLRQAKDHLKWADYSYVCFFADTYLPAYIIDEMITNGIGLLLWKPEIFVEVIQSGYNKFKDKIIHDSVIKLLKKRESIKTGMIESEQQKKMFEV